MIADMAMRFNITEKNQYAQIRDLRSQIQTVNNNYEVLKSKPKIFIQNILLFIVAIVAMMSIPSIFYKIVASDQEPNSLLPLEIRILAALIVLLPIILIILNVIRGKIKHKKRIRKANEWWEQVGRSKVVELNSSIEAIQADAYEYLSENQLYESFAARGWDNSKDCVRVYNVTVRHNLSSIQQAFAVYEEVLVREYEREQDRYQQQQILEAIEENNRYQAELTEQGRRAEFDRSILELQLHEIKHRR